MTKPFCSLSEPDLHLHLYWWWRQAALLKLTSPWSIIPKGDRETWMVGDRNTYVKGNDIWKELPEHCSREYRNPGSLEKCACGDISAKWFYVASYMFGDTFPKWNVQEVELKVCAVLSKTDTHESGKILLLCLLYVMQQFGNEVSGVRC